ncbi:MAG: SDR family oxidoreductase [Planctomycetes bacterium]|nr:SDR family oxidoreductase [Planctomycetota bacterium]
MRLQDKSIVVTGSTTGIGEAMARRFIAEGAQVLVHGRDASRGKKIVDSLGSRAVLHVDDLSDPRAALRIAEAALEAFGKIDGLVNNAACTTRRDLQSTDAAFFDQLIAINLRAPLLLIRALVEALARTRGTVLNIGSVLGYCGESNLLAYCVSKGGLMTLSRNLADSLCHRGIRVNHLNVGWTLTENEYMVKVQDGMSERWPEQLPAEAAPSGRLIKPEEIAAAAVYWLSDESRPISGSVVELEQYPVIGRFPAKKEV